MYTEEFGAVVGAARTKLNFLTDNPIGYFVASMLAGIYVGFGILLIFTIGGQLAGAPATKLIMGACFGVALSLVIMAGSELFTGNNLVMAAGVIGRSVSLGGAIKLWIVCYIGNWIGSILLAALFYLTGAAHGPVGDFIAATSATKMGLDFIPLIVKAILCNILVCLATWSSFKLKSESGKLIMVFWCLFAFITAGFEHSIANMTLLSISLFAPGESAISMGGYFYNILGVSLGNMIGGILFVAVPYYLISRKREPTCQ